MRKSNSSPKQSNTLLNYFNKSQTTPKSNNNSPKSSKSDDLKSNNVKNKASLASTSNQSKDETKELPFNLYDLVWAKLEGYPWWPSIVCLHPSLNSFTKRKGKTEFIHVQFFDDPVSRAWIKLRDVKEYFGKVKSDVPLLKDSKWNQAIEFADQALKLEQSQRFTLIADLKPSDDEIDDDLQDLNSDKSDGNHKEVNKYIKYSPPKHDSKHKNGSKSDLKRKGSDGSDRQRERRDRKKFKKLELSEDEFASESEDEYKPHKSDESSDDEEEAHEIIISDEEMSFEEEDDSEDDSKARKHSFNSNKKFENFKSSPKNSFAIFSKSPKEPKRSDKKSDKNRVNNSVNNSNIKLNKSCLSVTEESFVSMEQNSDKVWSHLKQDFLKPEKIKDKNGKYRLIGGELNPDYDPTTVLIPNSFLESQTPAHKQWWTFKSTNFDTVLFFKMGKFYELFHMDAVIAVNELHISYMRGEWAHAGFPEKAYKRYADVLIQKGYKVARIEQTETPQMMEERCKHLRKPTKFDRVVARELCRVSTIGTRMCSVIDADLLPDGNSFLLAIAENVTESESEFGVCFIDVSIGKFHLSQFCDDRYCSRLRTLMAHNPPVELIISRKNISVKTKQLLETCTPKARKQYSKEFWSANKTLKFLNEGNHFEDGLPDVIVEMLDETDSLHQTAKPEYELAIRSLGAVIEYCNDCLIADEVLSMKLFEQYKPCDSNRTANDNQCADLPNNMILDSFTLRNLEIFQNSLGGTEGTLNEVLDFCSTPFGKRLMHYWICAPLCNIEQIQARQMAVTDLSNVSIRYEAEEAIKSLKKLPDLERLLSKIHSQGSKKRSQTHPDSRAILFEMDIYSKRKIMDFLSVLDGFKQSLRLIETLRNHISNFKSSILINCLKFETEGGSFPHLEPILSYFDNAFDHKKAKQEGKVLPQTGTDAEYDQLITNESQIIQKLDNYLIEQKRYFGCKVSYVGSGKNRFQLEVPESAAKKITKENKDYEIQSARKGFKRYWTPVIKRFFEELVVAEEAKEAVLQDIMRRIFEKFDKHYHKWLAAVNCLSLLDVFLSLSKSRSFLQQNKANVCLPKFIESKTPSVRLINSSNPCLLKYCDNFIPNDIIIESELLLLTGPNMGGKSTLMRQLGLIVIMAQMGAYVPAHECLLTPVDRIFTRLGAFDRIIEGESTFFVELSETSMVLRHATKHSLVLIDELGRGTSTFDGTAIACSVAKELSENIKCRTLFSSHYHSLVDEFKNNPSVKLVHMACMIENENQSDPTQESITFLYKLKQDSCPKSYGFNAAQLAGIPNSVIRNAFKKAQQFEQLNQIEKIFRKVIENQANDEQIMSIVPLLRDFSLRA